MLTVLAICSKKKFTVEEYSDNAVGYLEKDKSGNHSITSKILRPKLKFNSHDKTPSEEELERIHQSAHKHCFIANSVKTDITIEQGFD